MSYSNPNRQMYSFGIHDIAAAGQVFDVLGPKGKAGRVYDFGVMHVTETFNEVTTAALISVGTIADPNAYAEAISMGSAAVDSGGVSYRNSQTLTEIIAAEVALSPEIPADTIIGLHVVANTGGTPAGIAIPFLVIDWDD